VRESTRAVCMELGADFDENFFRDFLQPSDNIFPELCLDIDHGQPANQQQLAIPDFPYLVDSAQSFQPPPFPALSSGSKSKKPTRKRKQEVVCFCQILSRYERASLSLCIEFSQTVREVVSRDLRSQFVKKISCRN
jgi:hypothetical protein